MVQTLGYGVKRANALVHGLGSSADTGSPDEVELTHAIRMTSLWVEAIRTTRKAPEVKLASKYYPMADDLEGGLRILDSLKSDKRLEGWILATKDDLPAFQLVSEQKGPAADPGDEVGEVTKD
jgi:hypothetical protein